MGRPVFKAVAEKRGGHYHVDVYVAPSPTTTYARTGTLVMSEADYDSFTDRFAAEHIDKNIK
jgi:hypothetical protein